jgi:hypothetical protein
VAYKDRSGISHGADNTFSQLFGRLVVVIQVRKVAGGAGVTDTIGVVLTRMLKRAEIAAAPGTAAAMRQRRRCAEGWGAEETTAGSIVVPLSIRTGYGKLGRLRHSLSPYNQNAHVRRKDTPMSVNVS